MICFAQLIRFIGFIGLLWICEVADSLSCLCGLWVYGVYAFKVLWCMSGSAWPSLSGLGRR